MSEMLERIISIVSKILLILNTKLNSFRFMSFGNRSTIGYGCVFNFPNKIWIENNVTVCDRVWLNAYNLSEENDPSLFIGSGSYLSRDVHINAYKSVTIENHVLIGEGVYIGDTDHVSSNTSELPIIKQGWECKSPVLLKVGCYISKNAIILPGVTVGRNAIVGPNAVVTMNIPDYAVAWGNPARIIKLKQKN